MKNLVTCGNPRKITECSILKILAHYLSDKFKNGLKYSKKGFFFFNFDPSLTNKITRKNIYKLYCFIF